ncbi:hypothetical protein IscW_ISCW011111 [Ixodes scapularis]|uniref:Uncharacterized protein n=1 Tax=Ixodes scapularis TaxID=6945 RepID=B7Q6W2_IXOSC|nr:hypothetical protein IscW_ISCW011111 [Ixodes scapularis]|eukprot:XP_002412043.1 hypothetical protein IscW_ISCW011111 [Ixodes scapularis]
MFTTATMHISTGTHAQLPQALCTSLEQYKLFHSHHTHPVADTFYVLFLVHIIHTRLNCVLWRLAASKQHHKIVKTACLFYSFSQPQCALKVHLQRVRLSQGRSGYTRCFEERNGGPKITNGLHCFGRQAYAPACICLRVASNMHWNIVC